MNSTAADSCSLTQYAPPAGRYDECKSPDGRVRQAWRLIAEQLEADGTGEVNERANRVDLLLRENGATFNVEGESGRQTRPWQLAPVPLVLEPDSWATLEAGLKQRTRLLEAVLADLLGPQRLLRERVIPVELLMANPHFQRAYHGLPETGGMRLHVSATDVARAPDGSWWVIGDRTRAPSGLGYLLENRIVTSRVLPNLIRRCNVRRLARFFEGLRSHLRSLAPRMRDNPRVVLLTPGQDSYRAFEDTYLARYLGLTLVQGRDLAVRGGRLNLKTLGGLLPIEVLWRHVSDRKCDPLELEPDSQEGVTGLLRIVRQREVAIANSIGTVMAQMPALLPFLAGAAKFLFDESLLLPNAATYWCGGGRERQYVLEHLDSLVIRPAFAVTGMAPTVPSELSKSAREELVEAIQARPHEFVAQQRLTHSTTPVWNDNRWQPWHVALRTYQLQTDRGVDVLPGALARANPVEHVLGASPTSGQLTLDCWVSSPQPIDHDVTLLPPADAKIVLKRGGDDLPSRVAEQLFWLGRYAERCEGIARILRTTLIRLTGEDEWSQLPEVPRLIAALAAVGQIEPDYAIEGLGGKLPTIDEVLPSSVFDANQPRGLQSSIRSAIKNATAVRDRLSVDAYRIIRSVSIDLGSVTENRLSEVVGSRIMDRLNRLIADLLAFAGLASESMTRTHGWRFLELGRRIERADQTSELIAAMLTEPAADQRRVCEAVLGATDSLMTYRSRYLALVQPAPTLDLLVTDETNPRSLRYNLEQVHLLLGELPSAAVEVGLGMDEKIAEDLLHRLRMADPEDLSRVDSRGKRGRLDELLQRMIQDLPRLSDAVSARYLIHTAATQDLTGVAEPESP